MTLKLTTGARVGLLVMLAALSGCATSRPTAADTADLVVYADAEGQLWFNGRAYPADRLGAALKAVRVPSNQPIRINIPDPRNRKLFVGVASALRSAGYSRIFFVSEQHAESAVTEPGRPHKPGDPSPVSMKPETP